MIPLARSILLAALAVASLPLASAVAAPATPRPTVLILPFDVGEGGGDDLRASLLADLIGERLDGSATLVDREALPKLLAEQELSLKGLVDPEKAARVGKILGADAMVAGRVFRLGDATVASVRVIDVKTARVKGLNVSLPGEPEADAIAARTGDALATALPRILDDLSRPDAARAPSLPAAVPFAGAVVPTVAVLNFEHLGQGDPAWEWLGKGLADLTIGDLAGVGLRVVSREQMQEMAHELEVREQQKAREDAAPGRPNVALGPRPARDPEGLARVLKAARCVHGTFRVEGGRIEVNATVIEVEGGKQVHAATRKGDAANLLALQKEIAAELADVLSGRRPGTVDPASLPRWTESLKASELLYRGIDLFDRGRYLDAWGFFRRALKQDAQYADASYWAGRMMYYEQEYHQARVGLERFAADYPEHPRVGDAVMEIVSAAQLTAGDAREVLEVLAFASQLAPRAEVPNQFGAGSSSTVGLYAAGLAAQILRAQGRYGDAFKAYEAQIGQFPVEHPLYRVARDEMIALRLSNFKATGQLLPLPPPHVDPSAKGRPVNPSIIVYDPQPEVKGGRTLEPRFIQLSPGSDSVTLDFSKDPIKFLAPTFTFAADPDHYLEGLEIEFRHHLDERMTCFVRVAGDVSCGVALDPSGVVRQALTLPPGTRAVGMELLFFGQPKGTELYDKPTTAITSWTVKAKLRRFEGAPGKVVLRAPDGGMFRARVDGVELPVAHSLLELDHMPPGPHTLRIGLGAKGDFGKEDVPFKVEPGATVELPVDAQAVAEDQVRAISTPYEAFRSGAVMGDQTGKAPGDVRFLRDRAGRWIVVWTMRRNLYMTTSVDEGKTWAPTTLMPTPVNSAHDERMPTLSQDDEGRYILAFSSDRNLAHAHAVYACWSDDLANFSAPVMIAPDPGVPLRILRRSDGTYLAYSYFMGTAANDNGVGRPVQVAGFRGTLGDRWAVCTSTDLVRWSSPKKILSYADFPAATRALVSIKPAEALDIVEHHGRFLALAYYQPGSAATVEEQAEYLPARGLFTHASDDGLTFSPPTNAGALTIPWAYQAPKQVTIHRVGGQLLAFPTAEAGHGGILRRSADGSWERVVVTEGFGEILLAAGLGGPYEGVSWGDFAMGEDALCFFGTKPTLSAFERSRADAGWTPREEPGWLAAGQPLFMIRHGWRPTPPSPDELSRVNLPTYIQTVALSPDGRRALIADFNRISLWDLGGGPGSREPLFDRRADQASALAFSPDGRKALAGGPLALGAPGKVVIKVFDAEGGKELRRLAADPAGIHSIAVSPDGRRALSGGGTSHTIAGKLQLIDCGLRAWDLASDRPPRLFEGHEGYITGIAFAPDGRRAAFGCADKAVHVLDVETGREVARLGGGGEVPSCVAYSPDGRRVLSGAWDNVARLWDVEGGNEVRKLVGHEGGINTVAFSPDGHRALTSSYDRTARLWDLDSGKELRKYAGHGTDVKVAAFSPDGRKAITIGLDGTARTWRIPETEEDGK